MCHKQYKHPVTDNDIIYHSRSRVSLSQRQSGGQGKVEDKSCVNNKDIL